MNKVKITRDIILQEITKTTTSEIIFTLYANSIIQANLGARYLDPRTSRWLSVDPALGEYIPSPGQGADRLPGLGGIYNYVNFHVYHYSANNPIRYKDPDGRFTEEEIQHALDSIIAASPNATYHSYGTLINTTMLTNMLKSHHDQLDLDSNFYVFKTPRGDLENQLNNITVIMNIDKNTALAVLDQLGFHFDPDTQAVSVGNTILVFGEMRTLSNGRIRDQRDADLLGHEAIHSLQVLSVGSLTRAATMYQILANQAQREGRHPYYGHPWEIGPYNFGPSNTTAVMNGSSPIPIFTTIRNWHR